MLFSQNALRNLILNAFVLFSILLNGQDFELIKIQSALYPDQYIEESSVEGEIGIIEWGAQIAIPQTFKKNQGTILTHKFSYGNVGVNIESTLPLDGVQSKYYYHSILYNLGLIQTVHTNWRMVVNLIPTLASDFKEKLSGDDLLFQANALVVYSKQGKLKYGFGIAFTTRFGREAVIPMGLLKYNTKKIKVDIVLPNKLNVMIKTENEIFSYGLKAGLNGGVFNNTGEVSAVGNVIDEVGYSRMIMGPALTWRLKDAININIQGGVVVERRLEFIDINQEIIDRTPQTAPYIGVGLAFAPKRKKIEAAIND